VLDYVLCLHFIYLYYYWIIIIIIIIITTTIINLINTCLVQQSYNLTRSITRWMWVHASPNAEMWCQLTASYVACI